MAKPMNPDLLLQAASSASETEKEVTPAKGAAVIEAYVKTLLGSPGVYRMVNADGKVHYVGKAKNLKKRVANYVNPARQSIRIRRMIAETTAMEFVTTHTEAEALLLEANLIKRYAPRYNILLRDDKSFPSILVTADHEFPQVLKHRGAQKRAGNYFGPFASVWAVNETTAVLQRAFLLRSCTDTVFAARTRPCLLYQIKRCSAPCVGRIGASDYREFVEQARDFLSGGSQRIQRRFAKQMQDASDAMEFELAGQYRDRIRALTRIQARQDINMTGLADADVIAVHQSGGVTCVQVFFFRSGANFGNRAYFPSHTRDSAAETVLEAFVSQFYARAQPPKIVFVSHPLANQSLVAEALSLCAEHRIRIICPKRGDKRKLISYALVNAREALARRQAESISQRRLLEGLAAALGLDSAPARIEIYDNSHVSGSKAVGGMVVAGPDGFIKNAYRKFTIRGAGEAGAEADVGCKEGFSPGDDYAMMREMLARRFSRALKEDPDRSRGQWPDLILVDGGRGHVGVALEIFEDLGLDDISIAAIAKGPKRYAGRERIFVAGRSDPIKLEPRDPIFYFLQRLRDEAHRFANSAHRHKRSRALSRSILDDIPGVGARRKKALLHHFGGPNAVSQAGRADLEAVDGISKTLASKIYDWFYTDG